jgi:hypothetical protein
MENSTLNFTDSYSLDYWFDFFGIYKYADAVLLFFIPWFSFIGFILNLITFKVLLNEQFKGTKIFDYFKVYTLNSAFVCVVSVGNFLRTKRFIDFNSYLSMFFVKNILVPIDNTGYFYGSLLDILIILEQIFILLNRGTFFSRCSAYLNSIVLFVICLIVNFPFFFAFEIATYAVKLIDGEIYTIYLIVPSEFALDQMGEIILWILYVLRDILTPMVQIICNLLLVVNLKRHLEKKLKLLPQKSNKNISIKKTTEIDEQASQHPTNLHSLKQTAITVRKETNAAKMVITVSVLSILEHLSIFLILLGFQFGLEFTNKIDFLPNTSIVLKHSTNFLILIFFNYNFRKVFKILFKF